MNRLWAGLPGPIASTMRQLKKFIISLALLAVITSHGRQLEGQVPLDTKDAIRRLDSLDHVATSTVSRDERMRAVIKIAIDYGLRTEGSPPVNRGIVARLRGIYFRSNDQSLRFSTLGLMLTQAERPEAIAFLMEAAREAPTPHTGSGPVPRGTSDRLQRQAVGLLTMAGPEGEQALRSLYSQGGVRAPAAQLLLDKLVRSDFRRSPQ